MAFNLKVVKTWSIKTWNGSVWSAASDFHTAGGQPFNRTESSTSQYVPLADGSIGKSTPPTKKVNAPFDLSWPTVDNLDLETQLNGYKDNDTGVQITMHNGQKLEGFFADVTATPLLSGSHQRYIITAKFQPFDVDSSGDIGD